MNHLGWRPFKALGHKRAMKFWTHIGDNCITKWKMNRIYTPEPGFLANDLTSKVLLVRIKEVAILKGILTDK